eukprot:2125690-Pyramimonas_sp.AAC.1
MLAFRGGRCVGSRPTFPSFPWVVSGGPAGSELRLGPRGPRSGPRYWLGSFIALGQFLVAKGSIVRCCARA